MRVAPEISTILRMKRNAARTIPTSTATTMSNGTVRAKQTTSTVTSLLGAIRTILAKWRTSAMFQATTRRSAAMADIGM